MSRPFWILALFALSVSAVIAQERHYDLRLMVDVKPVATPVGTLVEGPELARSPEGAVGMLWVERGKGGEALRVAEFDRAGGRWMTPGTVAVSRTLASETAGGGPRLAIGSRGRMAVVWTEEVSGAAGGGQRAMLATSSDGGRSWTAPCAISAGSEGSAWPSVAAKPGGGWTLAWIGRGPGGAAGGDLCFEADEAAAGAVPSVLVAPVSLASPALAGFEDGSSLVVYRGLTKEGAGDPIAVRVEEAGGRRLTQVGRARWMAAAPGVPAVMLSRSGPLAAASWYTAPDGEPRILNSMTPDGGLRWTEAQRCDLGRAVGPVAVAILGDGSQLVLWTENPGSDISMPGGTYLRRYAGSGASSMPALIEPLPARGVPGPVRLAVLREGEGRRAELLATIVRRGTGGRLSLRCLVLRLPAAAQLALLDSDCKCGPGSLPGYPIRGRILTVDANRAALTIHHTAVPGLFRPGDLPVRVDPAMMRSLSPGREFLGRIEKKEGQWWLSEVRLFE